VPVSPGWWLQTVAGSTSAWLPVVRSTTARRDSARSYPTGWSHSIRRRWPGREQRGLHELGHSDIDWQPRPEGWHDPINGSSALKLQSRIHPSSLACDLVFNHCVIERPAMGKKSRMDFRNLVFTSTGRASAPRPSIDAQARRKVLQSPKRCRVTVPGRVGTWPPSSRLTLRYRNSS